MENLFLVVFAVNASSYNPTPENLLLMEKQPLPAKTCWEKSDQYMIMIGVQAQCVNTKRAFELRHQIAKRLDIKSLNF